MSSPPGQRLLTADREPERAPAQPVQQPDPQSPSRRRLRFAPSSIVLFGAVFWAFPLIGIFFARYVNILLIVFLAVLFSTFLTPAVNALDRLRISRAAGILLVYLAIIGVVAGVAWLAAPLFVNETQRLIDSWPAYVHRFAGPLRQLGITLPAGGGQTFKLSTFIRGYLGNDGTTVTGVAGQAVGIISTVGALLIELVSILVMAFLLTVRRTFTADLVNTLIPPDYRRRWIAVMSRMGERMGGWVIGQIIITVYYGVAFSAGLSILKVPNPISIGVITGVLEIIPFVGGFMGLLLAAVVALSVSPFLVVWVVVLYLIVTNVEAHILVPYIYGRAVHVHPFLVVVALLVGAETFGILGAIVAVPIAAALQVAVENLYVKEVVEAAEQSRERARKPVVDVTRWFRDRRQRGRQAG